MVGCSVDKNTCQSDFTGALSDAETGLVGTWVLTDMVADKEVDLTDDGVENPSTEIFDQLPDCQKDVEYTFDSDRSYMVRQEYNAMDCTNKQTFNGTWSYSNGQLQVVSDCILQTLNIEISGDATTFTLVQLITFNDVYGYMIKGNTTITYTKVL